jgi:hypothetical protein
MRSIYKNFIDPENYMEPDFHKSGLDDQRLKEKARFNEEEYTRLELILAQLRHRRGKRAAWAERAQSGVDLRA